MFKTIARPLFNHYPLKNKFLVLLGEVLGEFIKTLYFSSIIECLTVPRSRSIENSDYLNAQNLFAPHFGTPHLHDSEEAYNVG